MLYNLKFKYFDQLLNHVLKQMYSFGNMAARAVIEKSRGQDEWVQESVFSPDC